MVSKSLLCTVKESALEAMFSGRHTLKKIDGKLFIDRDPEAFKNLISFLRNNCQILPIDNKKEKFLFIEELKYWGL